MDLLQLSKRTFYNFCTYLVLDLLSEYLCSMFIGSRGLHRDVLYLGWPIIAPSYMSPNGGGGGNCGVPANEYNCVR